MRFWYPIVVVMMSLALWPSTAPAVAQEGPSGTPEEICAAAEPAEEPATREYDAPENVLEPDLDYRAVFCTETGPVYVDLFETLTPVTVNNFVFLAQNGYYNNTTFHRVLEDFMAQGGDPTATGTGGPGYQFQDEILSFVRFDRPGLLAMANTGPATNGSQFFLTTAITDWLDFNHTIFGEVLTGQDNVDNLPLRDPDTATTPGPALNTVVIVTDPAAVEADYEVPERATSDDMLAAFDEIPELPGVTLDETATGVAETADFVQQIAEPVRDDVADYLARHDHQYTATVQHINDTCNLAEAPFGMIGYRIHVFDTPEAATAAVADPDLVQLLAQGEAVEVVETDFAAQPIYSWPTVSCEFDSTHAVMITRNGRFITVAESIFPEGSEFPADLWLYQLVRFQVYENILGDVLRREVVR